MFKKSLCLLFCITLNFGMIFSQNAELTKKTYYFDSLAISFYKNNNDSSVYYTHKTLKYAGLNNDSINYAYALTFLGVLMKEKGEIDSALYYSNKALKWQKLVDFPRGVAGVHNNLATTYRIKGDYLKAVSNYRKALEVFKHVEDDENTMNVIQNLSELYILMGKESEALQLLKESDLKYANGTKKKYGTLYRIISKADILKENKSFKKANELYYESLELTKSFNLKNEGCRIYNKIADTHIKLDNAVLADSILEINIHLARKLNMKYEEMEGFILKSKMLGLKGENLPRKHMLNQALSLEKTVNSTKLSADLYAEFKNYFRDIRDFKNAYLSQEKLFIYRDSLKGIEVSKAIEEVEVKYQVKEKDIQILRLSDSAKIQSLENDKLKLKSEQSAKNKNIFGGIMVISLIVMFLFIQKFRQKKKLSKKIQKSLEERDILLKEIHHRVKNNLQIVNSLLNLQSKSQVSDDTVKILNQSKDRIHTMSVIHEKLYNSDNLTDISASEYFNDLIKYFITSYNLTDKNILIQSEIEDFSIKIDQLVPLGLIVNEIVTNSIKHAFDENGGKILIKAQVVNNLTNFVIEDNGKGLPDDWETSSKNSLGIKLVKGLSVQLKAKLNVEPLKSGTKFKISFKVI